MDSTSRRQVDKTTDPWENCPPGTLRQIARNVERRQSARRWISLIGASTVGAACVLLVLGRMDLDLPANPLPWGGSSIGEHRGSVAYRCINAIGDRDGFLLGSASPEVQAAVRNHLSHCAQCRQAYRNRAQELEVEYTVLVLPKERIYTVAAR